jgi:hypothetical protein
LADEQERAFARLKVEIGSDKFLAHPSMELNHQFRVHMDASDQGISAVITQVQDGQEQPDSYASRQLHKVKKKLTVPQRNFQRRCLV